jgi:hypothetical protein
MMPWPLFWKLWENGARLRSVISQPGPERDKILLEEAELILSWDAIQGETRRKWERLWRLRNAHRP